LLTVDLFSDFTFGVASFSQEMGKRNISLAGGFRISDRRDLLGHFRIELSIMRRTFCRVWRNSERSELNVLNVAVDTNSVQEECLVFMKKK
jgi:hypothetical protein